MYIHRVEYKKFSLKMMLLKTFFIIVLLYTFLISNDNHDMFDKAQQIFTWLKYQLFNLSFDNR